MAKPFGMVYLVGAGPGDPGLLTRKGAEVLASAEVLISDRLASEELLKLAPADCERIYVGKEPGRHSIRQEEISRLLAEKALAGKLVVRLKGGDSFVFGRGGEEIQELERCRIAYELVPGVTSAVAALEAAGIPVTHREVSRSFHVITGHTAAGGEDALFDGFEEYAKLSGTLVFLMGMGNLERITDRLISCGKPGFTPAALVTDGTLPGMRCVRAPLSEIAEKVREAGLRPPGILAVGETAAFHMTCEEKRPLAGVTIGITGTDAMFEKLSGKLFTMGARLVRATVSRIVPENRELLEQAVRALPSYDWIVFTSRNGVSIFFQAVREQKVDLRAFRDLHFAAIGSGTAEFLSSYGFYADYVPEEYTSKALAKGLCETAAIGERILIPRAKQGSAALTEILSDGGFSVHDLPVYDIVTERGAGEALKTLDYLTFESASGVRGFFENGGEGLFADTTCVCIGDVTRRELEKYRHSRILTAKTYTADGVLEAILRDKRER